MIKDIEQLKKLGILIHRELPVDLILQSHTSSFASFVMNYNMNKLNYTLPELMNMLESNEGTLKSSRISTVLTIEHRSSSKRESSLKEKKSAKKLKKEKESKSKKKDTPKKAAASKGKYFYCHADGHWKRNCSLYLKSRKKQKVNAPSKGMSNLLVIESNLIVFSTSNWVLDSGSNAHICTSMQSLVESRQLRKEEMVLCIDNDARVVAVAVRRYPL
ncbi:uncharacterized protein [Elaeis guineensis]|uniref:uncharacterized protein n=1 Tax=Elaeis guineensis var. tenera TaxID=51953 RepID=UPI003C6CD638